MAVQIMIVALKLEAICSSETLEQTFIMLCTPPPPPRQSPLSKMSTLTEQVSIVVIQESFLGSMIGRPENPLITVVSLYLD
jgi:hypothetical protein